MRIFCSADIGAKLRFRIKTAIYIVLAQIEPIIIWNWFGLGGKSVRGDLFGPKPNLICPERSHHLSSFSRSPQPHWKIRSLNVSKTLKHQPLTWEEGNMAGDYAARCRKGTKSCSECEWPPQK